MVRRNPDGEASTQVVNGIGISLFTPRTFTVGDQSILVTLAVGTRNERANISSVWLTYHLPQGGTPRTGPEIPGP
ncbi:MAG TPA: hypothetical protein VFS39_05795 [Nitrospira sp.]|nr:hypothetical protein [Nitrospira sp.]